MPSLSTEVKSLWIGPKANNNYSFLLLSCNIIPNVTEKQSFDGEIFYFFYFIVATAGADHSRLDEAYII